MKVVSTCLKKAEMCTVTRSFDSLFQFNFQILLGKGETSAGCVGNGLVVLYKVQAMCSLIQTGRDKF